MKTIVVGVILAVSACLAGNAVSIGPETSSEYNAQWNLFRQGEVRCDRVGQNCYGCNDDTTLYYTGTAINLAGYDGVRMNIVYMQDAADDGDYCQLWLAGEDHYYYNLVHTFENSEDVCSLDLMLDGYYGVRDLGIKFEWVSDGSGVDRGFRVYSIAITGVSWGEGDYTTIFTWDASDDVTGHQSIGIDWMLFHANMNCLSYKYTADADSQGWWAIDNVQLMADGESVLPLQGGGYGIEEFENGGWYQDRHGLPGGWETDSDHRTGDMYSLNWQCDSAAHSGWQYEAETITPWVALSGANEVGVDFDTWFHPVGAGESASLGLYGSGSYERTMYLEFFDDFKDWHTFDYGSNVTETSWGAIKAGF
ncbi:MAG: hypothetical protein NTW26_09615 [bacterium]|nr:hypothetical protein [bacterium]